MRPLPAAAAAAAALLLAACQAEQPQPDRYLLMPAAELPALTGRVVDNADLLPPEVERRLTAVSETLERRTGDQLVVVTVSSLNGRPLLDYGVSLGRHWRIGQTQRNNGVLLLVAAAERQARIEVGCGLERVLPDEIATVILRERMIPRFRAGEMPAGIAEGSEAIVARLMERAAAARGGEC